MNKIWCSNNLDTVGKRGKAMFLFGFITVAFLVFVVNISPCAHALSIISTDQPTELKNILNAELVGGLAEVSSRGMDFSRFFSLSTISQGDVTGFFKEAVIIGIKLSILIISITTQVITGLLGVFKQ